VIGDAEGERPWVLSLTGYADEYLAQRAINWQRIGQGQFDPPDYWKIVTTDELRALLPSMTRSPYTQEAWDRFTRSIA
jgi:hypothetical protein